MSDRFALLQRQVHQGQPHYHPAPLVIPQPRQDSPPQGQLQQQPSSDGSKNCDDR
jgi:hypothetical protein